jgi:LysR family glycine cleavage system transcriptional activator
MTYRLPSLNGLRAFEASARHLSFKRAATELCVTPGAVSQQVKTLETAMGVDLFQRMPRGLLLTDAGEAYLAPISDAFRAISRATDDVSVTLKSRAFRLGIADVLGAEFRTAIAQLRDDKTNGPVVVISEASDPSMLLDGRIDALLRQPIASHPGLYLDQLEFRMPDGEAKRVTLAMVPGIAGCREHKLLLKAMSKIQT